MIRFVRIEVFTLSVERPHDGLQRDLEKKNLARSDEIHSDLAIKGSGILMVLECIAHKGCIFRPAVAIRMYSVYGYDGTCVLWISYGFHILYFVLA